MPLPVPINNTFVVGKSNLYELKYASIWNPLPMASVISTLPEDRSVKYLLLSVSFTKKENISLPSGGDAMA